VAERERTAAGLDQQGIAVAVIAAVELMILSRFVKPRARRMALMQASVPELVMRTFCTLGTSEQMKFGHRDLERIRMRSSCRGRGGLDGGDDFRMRVPENGRSHVPT